MHHHLPQLSTSQARGLAWWSLGIVLAQACGLTRVAALLAALAEEKEGSVRQRLREWYYERGQKRGPQRSEWAVGSCFAPLLGWVLAGWPPEERRLALALDATSLQDVLVVLSVNVLYRGCAIPVAWAVLPANQPGGWQAHWLELLSQLQGAVPPDWQVLVLTDRGLYARWLYRAIRALGFHPFMRLNWGGYYRPQGQAAFRPLRQLWPVPGAVWAGAVTCFAQHPVEGTLLTAWERPADEPWLLLTDLPPAAASARWYGLRAWVEAGFKDLKRDGWDWHKTRMTRPQRAARFWLALAVATLWVLSVGGQAEVDQPATNRAALPANHIAHRTHKHPRSPRQLSCFQRGLTTILARLLKGHRLPRGRFFPEPWP